MALRPELVLAEGRAVDREARLRAAPEPRLLPRRIIDHLYREGCEHGAARLTFEYRQLDELFAELAMVNERAFKLADLDGNLRLELDIADRHGDRGAPSDDQSKARIEAELRECGERSAELKARSAALSARTHPIEQRVQRCRERVAAAMRGGAPLRFIAPPAVDKKNTIAAARERVLQIGADIKEIEAAPHTSGEVKEIISRWLDEKAAAPAISQLFDRGREGSGPFFHGVEVNGAWQPDMLGLVLWLGRDEIVRRLHAEADRLADDAHALGDDERVKKIEKCKAALLDAERVEECLAWQALQDGAPIVLRADADVRAILSIA
jgi:hypothetical protein